MAVTPHEVLVVGATGSVGRLVVDEALRAGHAVRALVRDPSSARKLAPGAEVVVADLTRPGTLRAAVEGVEGIVFTHGSDGGGRASAEAVDYAGVRDVLAALGSRAARIALMTSIGVTNRNSSYNRSTEAHDWKRRSERLVRASGLPYTIVRPGWFDSNAPDQQRLVFLQGDRRHAGAPSDGVISRRQLAQVLVLSLGSASAAGKTLELVATKGPAPTELDPLFAAIDADPRDSLDGVRDLPNMPLDGEPERVRRDLDAVFARRSADLSAAT